MSFTSQVPPGNHDARSRGQFTLFLTVFYINRTYSESQNSRQKWWKRRVVVEGHEWSCTDFNVKGNVRARSRSFFECAEEFTSGLAEKNEEVKWSKTKARVAPIWKYVIGRDGSMFGQPWRNLGNCLTPLSRKNFWT